MVFCFVFNYRHSLLGLDDEMIVFHSQRDYAAVEIAFVRVAETVVGRAIVHRLRGNVTARVFWHQHRVLRFARFQLSSREKKQI